MLKVTLVKNGPLKCEGEFEIVTSEGKTLGKQEGDVYLCRCGHSKNKPFCDSSHRKTGFKG